ncbi:hypothetical protein [Pelotomaculum terephthalicicum]|nr:hypothetical protein [Pelotomaculum terephthalicicum]
MMYEKKAMRVPDHNLKERPVIRMRVIEAQRTNLTVRMVGS